MQNFQKLLQGQFDKMCQTGKLFRSSLSGAAVWDLYIGSFSSEHNPVYRDPDSSESDCNLCNNFIRRYGNIVALDENYDVMTIWDVDAEVEVEYVNSVQAISRKLKNNAIAEVFFETWNELKSLPYESCKKDNDKFRLGVAQNVKRYTEEEAEKFPGVVKPNEIVTFNHLYLDLPKAFVDMSGNSLEKIMGNFRDAQKIFKRAMDELPLDVLMLVKDLINQGSLLDGQTHLYKIEQIIPLKVTYDTVDKKENWCWVASYRLPFARFKNELIGVLCSELAEGVDINEACEAWNKRVDPANYMKATAPITKTQIEEAKKFIQENGYEPSFIRRYATMVDIKASEILHLNAGKGTIKEVSIFDKIKPSAATGKKNTFDGVEEVSIEKFMSDILPGCESVEAFLLNTHQGNMVSLTTADDKNSKPIFKWNNNYSWTYAGNLAGKSFIKEAVKSVGGITDAYLRFSITWNEDGRDIVDLDAHASDPSGQEIYYSSPYRLDRGGNKNNCGGMLDIDMIRPRNLGVENIFYKNKSELLNGRYKFWIHNYDSGKNKGAKAEIEINGDSYIYVIDKELTGNTTIAELDIVNGEVKNINHLMPLHDANRKTMTIYGLESNQFHKVNLVCLSPNHWDGNNVGNKHYFFMLEGCKCPTDLRSFHNENLISDLLSHRKITEVLGFSTMIKPTDEQLSGLGFNATVRDELFVKLTGTHKRVIKLKF